MATQSPVSNDSISAGSTDECSRLSRIEQSLESVKRPAQFVSFWAAIALPFLLVSLLVYGIENLSIAIAFGILLVANVAALIIGHGYNQS